jgi:hypothetical protein
MRIFLQPLRAISSVVSCSSSSCSFRAISQRARLVFGFENLAVEIRRKDDGVFFLRGVLGSIAYVDQIRAQRQLRSVFFNNAERQQTGALALLQRG